jgi:hypothetical protein
MEANLCSGFRKSEWPDLKMRLEKGDENAWSEAIGVFERRMRERFFSSIDALIASDAKRNQAPLNAKSKKGAYVPGFSIMALCCLLIDTLQGFEKSPSLRLLRRGCAPSQVDVASSLRREQVSNSSLFFAGPHLVRRSSKMHLPKRSLTASGTASSMRERQGSGLSGETRRTGNSLRSNRMAMP